MIEIKSTPDSQSTGTPSCVSRLVPLSKWLKDLDKSRSTGYRWAKLGIIKTVTIANRPYISLDEVARFEARAMAGELAEIVHPANN